MHKFVIDANIVIKWFLSDKEQGVAEAVKIYSLLNKNKIEVWAPSFLLVEISNVFLQKKHLSETMMTQVLQRLQHLGIHFVEFESSEIADLVRLSCLHNLTSYDCLYLLLAKQKRCPLVTTDKQLLKAKDLCISLDEFVAN